MADCWQALAHVLAKLQWQLNEKLRGKCKIDFTYTCL